MPATRFILSHVSDDFSRGGIGFTALADDQRIACFVSRETLREHFGGSGSDAPTLVEVFHAKQSRIRTTVCGKIADGALEPDGSLLLRSADFWM